MEQNQIINQLDKLNFNSLDILGIDWRTVVENNSELKQDYMALLKEKSYWHIVNLDFSQLELYVLASISGDKNMIQTVNSGLDLHSENTKNIYNIDYSFYEKEVKKFPEKSPEWNEIHAILTDFKTKRKSIKALSFSLTYGAGADKISMDQKISIDEANKLINDFYTLYPNVKIWQDRTFLSAVQHGYIETPFGRRRATPKVYKRFDAYKAFSLGRKLEESKLKKAGEYWSLREELKLCKNTPIQSVASDMCSLAACKIKQYFKSGVRAGLLFWVHDAITFYVHKDDEIKVIERVREIMENEVKYPNDPVNYRTSIDIGFNYEWTSEIKREDWMAGNKQVLIDKALNDALEKDLNKKFKLVVKSSSLTMDSKYLKHIKEMKEDYFEHLVKKQGIEGVYTPTQLMAYLNNMSEEEYIESVGFDEEDLED